jgi:hypothetical protein
VYVGSRASCAGPVGAEELERDKDQEFAGTERTDGKLTLAPTPPTG